MRIRNIFETSLQLSGGVVLLPNTEVETKDLGISEEEAKQLIDDKYAEEVKAPKKSAAADNANPA